MLVEGADMFSGSVIAIVETSLRLEVPTFYLVRQEAVDACYLRVRVIFRQHSV